MIYGGKEIVLQSNITVEDILPTIDNNKHYFYIIQLPRCGASRIKIGKAELLHKRFSEYANLFYGTPIYVLRLISFPKANYGDRATHPNAIFESLMKQNLKPLQGKTNVLGSTIPTEWFDFGYKDNVIESFDTLKKSNSEIPPTIQKKSSRMKVGDEIEVLWKMENTRVKQYHPGEVIKVSNSNFTVKYETGDIDTHTNDVSWRHIS
jgi:hypothetical protein